MGYTVDKKTGKLILVHDVTVTSKAVNQPETQQQQQPAVDAALPAVSAAATTPPVSGTFVFPGDETKSSDGMARGEHLVCGKGCCGVFGVQRYGRRHTETLQPCENAKTR